MFKFLDLAHICIELGEIGLSSERLGYHLSLLKMLLSLKQFLLAIRALLLLLNLSEIGDLPFIKSFDFASYFVLFSLQLLLLVLN